MSTWPKSFLNLYRNLGSENYFSSSPLPPVLGIKLRDMLAKCSPTKLYP